jgi:hypothetical protein
MPEKDSPARGIICPTPACPGNDWLVRRTKAAGQGIQRIRVCKRCGAVIVTFEKPAFSKAEMPLTLFQKLSRWTDANRKP